MCKRDLQPVERLAQHKAQSEARRLAGLLEPLQGKPPPSKPKGRIAILSVGSRGDFQPYVALMLALQGEGYHVRMYGFSNHRSQAAHYNLEFFSMDYDLEDIFATDPLIRGAMTDGDVATFMKAVDRAFSPVYHEIFSPVVDDMKTFEPKLIVTGCTGRMFSASAAQALSIPSFWVDLQPFSPSSAYPSIIFDQLGIGNSCGGCANSLSHWLVMKEVCGGPDSWSQPDNAERRFRVHKHGFDAGEILPAAAIERAFFSQPLFPITVCVSPSLFHRPADWDDSIQLVGALTIPVEETLRSKAPDQRLLDFLEAGPAPVYIGWGSMVVKTPEHMAELACRSLYLSGQRGVVLAGWAHLGPQLLNTKAADYNAVHAYAEANIFFGNDLPHEWLFPRCKLTVQHGGSGTTHAALRSGKPTIVTPCFLDQFTYRRLVNERKAGVASLRLNQLTPTALAAAIVEAGKPTVQQAAAELGACIRQEDGAREVVSHIEKFIREKVDTEAWLKDLDERWVGFLGVAK